MHSLIYFSVIVLLVSFLNSYSVVVSYHILIIYFFIISIILKLLYSVRFESLGVRGNVYIYIYIYIFWSITSINILLSMYLHIYNFYVLFLF